jgi:hypothetical protein
MRKQFFSPSVSARTLRPAMPTPVHRTQVAASTIPYCVGAHSGEFIADSGSGRETGPGGAADILIWSLHFLSEQLRHRTHAVDWLFLQVSLKADSSIQYHSMNIFWKQ